MRQPVANKTHYANGVTLLDRQFEELFTHKKGPGALPATKVSTEIKPVRAAIIPHAPYELAGPCMAWAYKAIAERPVSKTFIIIGQAQHHTESGVGAETFITPYGEVRADQHLVRELVAKGNIALNDELHAKESIIEIQLPFLQYVFKSTMEQLKIVPILVNADTDVKALAIDIKETLLEQDKQATLIFVNNFTSYGRDFKYVPYTENIAENIATNDKLVLKAIQQGDRQAFHAALEETLIPLSAESAMELFFSYFSAPKAELEQYYLSGDINGDYKATVSYASLIVR